MATLAVTIDRSGLSLANLVIGGARPTANGFMINKIGRPDFVPRYSHAPDLADIDGKQLLAASRDQGTVSFSVVLFGSSAATLAALEAELETALWQFAYQVTVTVDGVARAWNADPSTPSWGEWLHGEADRFISRASVVIPVNP